MNPSVIVVTVKDEDKSLKYKYLIYQTYMVSPEDSIIKDCIVKAVENFGSEPSNIKVKISLDIE